MLQGDFSTLGLPDVLQIVGSRRKTGMLTVVATDAERTIYFNDGRVVLTQEQHDRYLLDRYFKDVDPRDNEDLRSLLDERRQTGKPLGRLMVERGILKEEELRIELQRQTEDQLYSLFAWIEGAFNFIELDIESAGAVVHEIDATELVMNAARQVDEWRRVRSRLPDMDAAVGMADGGRLEDLDETSREIAKVIPGDGMSIRNICAASGESELETCTAVVSMLDAGVLRPLGSAGEKPPAATPRTGNAETT
ncbi:MAG: hypothetical protein DRP79_07460 [Planctomycetota bacterium]|nr:MAG: hypothetical protein DRP79_07460 [Planctomycetota bacterium]